MVYLSALSLALNRPGAVSLEQVVASLFANDEQGAWYDPSDYSTMFEDATGLTPISTVEKAVGLIFDKRKGGLTARRNRLTFSEQLDNAAWTPTASTISANTSDTTDPIGTNTAEKYTNTAAADNITRTAAVTVVAATDYAFSIYAKKGTQDWLRLSGWADSLGTTIGFNAWFDLANGQTGSIASGAGGTAVSSSIQSAGNGWYRCIVVGRLTSATTLYPVACMTTADNVATRPATSNVVYLWGAQLDQASSASTYQKIVSGTGGEWTAGNHAYQTGSTARPVLRARYNLLTYSEQFDQGLWSKGAINTTGSPAWINTAVAPDGTSTADLVIPTNASAVHQISTNTAVTVVGSNTLSVYAKAGGYQYVQLMWGSGTDYANFHLSGSGSVSQSSGGSAAIQSVGNGWYRCLFTSTLASSVAVYFLPIQTGTEARFATTTGDGTSGIYLWGADLRVGTSAGDYQRIAAATDYATTSTITGQPFRPYLNFDAADGTADSLLTAAVDFTATDEMTVAVGLNKTSDASSACCVELSASADDTNGSFALFAPSSSGVNKYDWRVRGSVYNSVVTTSTTYNAPVRAVVVGIGEISDDVTTLRANKTQLATSASNLGTGNFGTHAMFIGRRNNASLPLSGHIHGLIVRAKTCTAGELDSLETYLAGKAGLTL